MNQLSSSFSSSIRSIVPAKIHEGLPSFVLMLICLIAAVSLFAQDSNQNSKIENQKSSKPLIVLVGDSTVTDTSGWGLGFKRYLNDNAKCINTAAGGRSSKSFITESRWEK